MDEPLTEGEIEELNGMLDVWSSYIEDYNDGKEDAVRRLRTVSSLLHKLDLRVPALDFAKLADEREKEED